MLLSGFDALYSAKGNFDFNKFEKEHSLKFPATYQIFVNSYKLGVDSLRKEYYWNSAKELRSPLLSYYFGEGKSFMSIEDFIDMPQAVELRKTDADEFSDENLGLMRIAFTNDAGGGGFYIGLKENNFGKIYKASWDFLDEDGGFLEIATDIFGFVKELKSSLCDFNGVDLSKIHKNWNEDFWRSKT